MSIATNILLLCSEVTYNTKYSVIHLYLNSGGSLLLKSSMVVIWWWGSSALLPLLWSRLSVICVVSGLSCCWSTWSVWCLVTSVRWGWPWSSVRLSLPPASPVRWRCSRRSNLSSSITKPWMRRYRRLQCVCRWRVWDVLHMWRVCFYQVRERLRVALERCSMLEDQLTAAHKEVRPDQSQPPRTVHWLI